MMKVHQQKIVPVIDYTVRGLCQRPYPNHRKGCPNYGKKLTCPPQVALWGEICDLGLATWLFFTKFNLAEHRARMKQKHPNWTRRQLDCCLYWQQGAKKPLKEHLKLWAMPGSFTTICPEAMGINVTETMKQIGIILEWPPETWTYQVAMGGWLIKEIISERQKL